MAFSGFLRLPGGEKDYSINKIALK